MADPIVKSTRSNPYKLPSLDELEAIQIDYVPGGKRPPSIASKMPPKAAQNDSARPAKEDSFSDVSEPVQEPAQSPARSVEKAPPEAFLEDQKEASITASKTPEEASISTQNEPSKEVVLESESGLKIPANGVQKEASNGPFEESSRVSKTDDLAAQNRVALSISEQASFEPQNGVNLDEKSASDRPIFRAELASQNTPKEVETEVNKTTLETSISAQKEVQNIFESGPKNGLKSVSKSAVSEPDLAISKEANLPPIGPVSEDDLAVLRQALKGTSKGEFEAPKKALKDPPKEAEREAEKSSQMEPNSSEKDGRNRAFWVRLGFIALVVLGAVFRLFYYAKNGPSAGQIQAFLESDLTHGAVRFNDLKTTVKDLYFEAILVEITARGELIQPLYLPPQTSPNSRSFEPGLGSVLSSKTEPEKPSKISDLGTPVGTFFSYKVTLKAVQNGRNWALEFDHGEVFEGRLEGCFEADFGAEKGFALAQNRLVFGPQKRAQNELENGSKNGAESGLKTTSETALKGVQKDPISGQNLGEKRPQNEAVLDLKTDPKMEQKEPQKEAQKVENSSALKSSRVPDKQQLTPRPLAPDMWFVGTVYSPEEQRVRVCLEILKASPLTGIVKARLRNERSWKHTRDFQGSLSEDSQPGSVTLQLNTRADQSVAGAGPILQDPFEWELSFHYDGIKLQGRALHRVEEFSLNRMPDGMAAQIEAEWGGAADAAPGVPHDAPVTSSKSQVESPTSFRSETPSTFNTQPSTFNSPTAAPERSEKVEQQNQSYTANQTMANSDPHVTGHTSRVTMPTPAAAALQPSSGLESSLLNLPSNAPSGAFVLPPLPFAEEAPPVAAPTAPVTSSKSQVESPTSFRSETPSTFNTQPSTFNSPTAAPAVGAYVLVGAAWLPLPHNGGHVTYPAAQVIGSAVGLFGGLISRDVAEAARNRQDKTAEVVFDGTDPVDAVEGAQVMILYVGEIRPMPDSLVRQYPQLDHIAKIEVAPTRRDEKGARRADLRRIAPGVSGFQQTRLQGQVDEISPQHTRWISRSIPPGSYIVSVNGEFFELSVR